MVAQTLVGETRDNLTPEMIEAGKLIVERLRRQLALSAAFWLYLTEQNLWRLFLASPLVSSEGPRKTYAVIQSGLRGDLLLRRSTNSALELNDITVLDEQDELIRAWRKTISTNGEIGGLRMKRTTVNGHFFEDAYIYLT
jgi:hypothetical protein